MCLPRDIFEDNELFFKDWLPRGGQKYWHPFKIASPSKIEEARNKVYPYGREGVGYGMAL